LSYAKPNKFNPLPVNIFAMLEDISKFFEPECFARNIKLKFVCSKNLTNILADEHQLRHCISNLLWNAINAIKKDGEMLLEAKTFKNKVVIKVTDNGGGMDSESEKHAFDIFYSTRPQGAGLGLSIAQRVAKSHGGKLTFENRKGEGCTFILTF
jgi:signal transduction histidine kinase